MTALLRLSVHQCVFVRAGVSGLCVCEERKKRRAMKQWVCGMLYSLRKAFFISGRRRSDHDLISLFICPSAIINLFGPVMLPGKGAANKARVMLMWGK